MAGFVFHEDPALLVPRITLIFPDEPEASATLLSRLPQVRAIFPSPNAREHSRHLSVFLALYQQTVKLKHYL